VPFVELNPDQRREALSACILFFAIVVGFSLLVDVGRDLEPSPSSIALQRTTDFLEMWSVGVAGLASEWLAYRSWLRLGLTRVGPAKYIGFATLAPIVCCSVVYLIAWATGLAGFRGAPVLLHGVAAAVVYAPLRLVAALGEEIGWRGALTPNLSAMVGPRSAGVVCGFAWAIWHYADILFFGYNAGTPAVYEIGCFTVSLIGVSVFLAWIRLASESVWPSTIFHGVSNSVVSSVFERATLGNAKTEYFTGEFGLGLAIAGIVLGVIGWRNLAAFRSR
jgi:membrane protease YdiL (CAAX protease family)